jgi:hypothetical protein
VFLAVLILHADPLLLRVACVVAFSFGLTAFVFGLRRPRVRPEPVPASLEPVLPESNPSPLSPSEPQFVMQQVVRLSLPSIPGRSTEMTQQEKVAAALVRAGIANPAGWTSSPPAVPSDNKSVSSIAVEDLPAPPAKNVPPMPQSRAHAGLRWGQLRWGQSLLLFGGPLVALISLYLLLRIR